MAKDADGNYYYDAGTVNELFDEVSLVEGDGELEVETPDGVSRVGGLASVLGEGAIYFLDNGDTTYDLEAAFHNPDDGAIQTISLGTVGSV
jgi:hypothetical protein